MFATLSRPRKSAPDSRSSASASKKVAMGLLGGVAERDITAFDRYIADPYYQHNPGLPNGIAAAKGLFTDLFAGPRFNVSVKRVVADGDLVTILAHYTVADDRGLAAVDLYRVRHGKIVEHWDVLQAVPETAANDNTMF